MSDTPFGGLFGDIFKILGQQGPDAWFETARNLALTVARGEDGDPNPDPAERVRLERLAPLVARHVESIVGATVTTEITSVNRTALTMAALEQWRPLVGPMLEAPLAVFDEDDDEVPAGLGQIAAAIGPLFTGFQLGSVAGHFSERAWSLAALALPREHAMAMLVVNNVASFAEEWSLDVDAATVFATARELAANVVLAQPGTADALRALLLDAVREATSAQGDIVSRLAKIVSPEDLATLMNDPEKLLDGVAVPEESDATRRVNAAVAALGAYFDLVATSVVETMFGPQPQLREAYRRYKLADARGEDAAAALFGVDAHGEWQKSAEEFVRAVVAEATVARFSAFLRADGLPSAEELTNYRAWLERIEQSPLQ